MVNLLWDDIVSLRVINRPSPEPLVCDEVDVRDGKILREEDEDEGKIPPRQIPLKPKPLGRLI